VYFESFAAKTLNRKFQLSYRRLSDKIPLSCSKGRKTRPFSNV
jgi:hypothetical protein